MRQQHPGQATTVAAVDHNRVGRAAAPEGGAAAKDALAAVWCRSVGTSWTLELHELNDDRTLGRITDWIISGVPIRQPPPDRLAPKLLAERGLRLVRNPRVGPRTRSRRGIGYACPDTEPITPARQAAIQQVAACRT